MPIFHFHFHSLLALLPIFLSSTLCILHSFPCLISQDNISLRPPTYVSYLFISLKFLNHLLRLCVGGV
jgi:hypothetical protein